MSHQYVALLRGVNVGGKNKIKMADLKTALEYDGLSNVRSYIQSGNIFFTSDSTDTETLTMELESSILKHFKLVVPVVIFSKPQWQKIIVAAPGWWGKDEAWKHNLLILLEPYDMEDVVAKVGTLKQDIEAMEPGDGVLYQSMSCELFGRTTTGKLASSPIYKRMTIRNFNTVQKLLTMF